MLDYLENFLLNQFQGKVVVQLSAILCAYVAGPVVQGFAHAHGIAVSVDPVKVQAELMTATLLALEWFKAKRRANPNSVAVQTDAAKLPQ